MRLTCPACGALSSLDVLIGHAGAREAVLAALKLPAPLGDLLIQYVALFRPAQRQLSFDKLQRLLGELQPLIEAGQIERGGRIWAAPHATWRAALEDMIAKRDKLTLPLKSHGYLLEIIAGQAGKAEAAVETGKETTARGVTPVGTHASHRQFLTVPEGSPHPNPLPQAGEGANVKGTRFYRPSPEAVKAGLEQVRSALKKGGNTDGIDA